MKIRALVPKDWTQVEAIFLEGIQTKNATFRTEVPSWADWNSGHHQHSRFVMIDNLAEIIGWIAIAPVSKRPAYKGVAEISIYIASKASGQGIGQQLLEKVIASSEKNGIWTLYASIFPENEASIHIHTKNGFEIVGRRKKIAQLDGIWRDTIILERRSELF